MTERNTRIQKRAPEGPAGLNVGNTTTMGNYREEEVPEEKSYGSLVSVVIGAAVWWFFSCERSTVAMVLAGLFLAYIFLGYCLLAVLLPGPDAETPKAAFVPLPQSETNQAKALPH